MFSRRTRPRTGQLFARARPREIQIYEDYFYEADLTSRPLVLPQRRSEDEEEVAESRPPQGQISVRVPYDGPHYFTPQGRADVEDAVKKARAQQTRAARIGYLALAGFDRTDLDEGIEPEQRGQLLPLDLPVYGDGLTGLDDLTAARHVGQLDLAYHPPTPQVVPVHVAVHASDEDTLSAPRAALAAAEEGEEWSTAVRNLLRRVDCPDPFLSALTLSFKVTLALPACFATASPQIKTLSLKWPVATSYQNLSLSLAERPGVYRSHPLHYRRHAASVEWGGIDLFRTTAGTHDPGRCHYRAPEMVLHVVEPDDLLGDESLQGEMLLEIPVPLSGGDVRFFNALGGEEAITVKYRSRLNLAFSLDLRDCFCRRLFSPFHHLQFPGVSLNQERLAAIKTLLHRQGFTLEREWKLSPGAVEDGNSYLLAFSRPEGPEQLRLWVRVEKQAPPPTEAPPTGRDGEPVPIPQAKGDMTIFLRAELPGDSQRPLRALNEIHRHLKKRFPRWKLPK